MKIPKQVVKDAFTKFPFCIATYFAVGMAIALFILGLKTRVP
jgi:hypothetical protein